MSTSRQFACGYAIFQHDLALECWLDAELNTEVTLKAGELYLDFDMEPPAPLERLKFRAHRNGAYYKDLVQSVKAAA
ncbi:MAG: hypothetical protein JXQ89_18085 [Pelagimonas sp.]